MCFEFHYSLCQKHFSFYEEFSKILSEMCIGFHTKYLLFLFDFNKTWIFSTYFQKVFIHKMSQKSVQWQLSFSMRMDKYRVSQEECARFRESVPYVKLYWHNPKHLHPKLNGYGDNGQRSLKLWQLLHTYWLPNTY